MGKNVLLESVEFFNEKWGNNKPYAKVIQTRNGSYIYDRETNKIIGGNQIEIMVIKELLYGDTYQKLIMLEKKIGRILFNKTIKHIIDFMKQENILKINKNYQFGLSQHYQNIEEMLEKRIKHIQLEVTEKCNMRCGYCIYNPHIEHRRNHGFKDMSFEIAKKAIQYLKSKSPDEKEIFINFYGGEPLLQIDLIKKCVNFIRRIIKDKKIYFSLTTNGILITRDIAKFLSYEDFSVTVSLDGPEELHNKYRKKINGNGSYNDTIRGLFNLVNAYKKKLNLISINMVYSPPFSIDKIKRMLNFKNYIPWLPEEVNVSTTYPISGSIEEVNFVFPSIDWTLAEWAIDIYKRDFISNININKVARNILDRKLFLLYNRPIYNSGNQKYNLNGCCVPGVKKLFVTPSGKFYPCERIPNAPNIGNVNKGINLESIKKNYIKLYENMSLLTCSDCWASRLCSMCYIHVFSSKKIDENKRERNCFLHILYLEKILKLFCELMEIDQNRLKTFLEKKKSN